jgi:hypothetical protein
MSKTVSTAIIIGIIFCITSCSKDNTSNTPTAPASPKGTYTFKGVSYTVTDASAGGNILGVDDYSALSSGIGTSVNFYFKNFPTASGVYRIVAGTTPTADSTVCILYGDNSTSSHYLGGPSVSGTATVTMGSNGKINITIANPVTLVLQSATPTDSGSFTANVNQQ